MKDLIQLWLPITTALLIWLERMREVATARDIIRGKREETLTLRLFIVCGVLMVFGGIFEYWLRKLSLMWPAFVIGLVISIGAFTIRRAAIRALGKFWSLHVEMREQHEFVRTGPFKVVRHPAYLSMILEHFGMALILGAYSTLAIVMAVFLPTLIARIRREEAALVRQFGTSYEDYRREAPAVIPFS